MINWRLRWAACWWAHYCAQRSSGCQQRLMLWKPMELHCHQQNPATKKLFQASQQLMLHCFIRTCLSLVHTIVQTDTLYKKQMYINIIAHFVYCSHYMISHYTVSYIGHVKYKLCCKTQRIKHFMKKIDANAWWILFSTVDRPWTCFL